MGLGASHGVCSCLPAAAGEFDLGGPDACSSSALPSLPPVPLRRPGLPDQQAGTCDELLPAHRRPRDIGGESRELISNALRANRLFASLEAPLLEELAATFEYYSFDQNEFVVREGEVGSYLFVSNTPGLEVMLKGGYVAELPRGRMFGELALLSKCPRGVSVMASINNVGVWGVRSNAFREAVLKAMVGKLEESRTFLDTIPLFQSLSVRQKDDVCDVSRLRVVEAETSVGLRDSEQEGSDHQQMFLVKAGELRTADARVLRPGDVIGDRTLLYREQFSVQVTATVRSELLVVNLENLRKVLRDELEPVRLLRDSFHEKLRRNSSFSALNHEQQQIALNNLEFQELKQNEDMVAPPLFVVADGSAKVDGVSLTKGQSYGSFPDPTLADENGNSNDFHTKAPKLPDEVMEPPVLVAGPKGCRLASLTRRKVSMTLEELGVDPEEIGWQDEEHLFDRMVAEITKVCVFRHLPSNQIKTLAGSITRQRYQKGDKVIEEGSDECSHFYILMGGEVFIKTGEEVVRSMTKYAYFGERALLFNEPRAATIEVTSEYADLWAIDAETFKKVAADGSQTAKQLVNRMWLQDHGIAMRDLTFLEELGCGTSGMVQLVQHKKTGFRYALKRVAKTDNEAMKLVRREIEVLEENDHPFIMHLVKTFETQKHFQMLTEFCSGGELHEAIRTVDVALSRPQAMFYTGSLVLMLEALAERSIVYRDLKPENIMLDDEGYLKLIDFGTAKKMDPNCPRTYTSIGTPHYMAPEVSCGGGYGIEVDIWSLGIILYELMCGLLPFADHIDAERNGVCEGWELEVIKEVQKGVLNFPDQLDRSARSLMEKLLVQHPSGRLGCGPKGYQEIKDVPFFVMDVFKGNGNKYDDYFALLLSRDLKAPLPPNVRELPSKWDADASPYPASPAKIPAKGDRWADHTVPFFDFMGDESDTSKELSDPLVDPPLERISLTQFTQKAIEERSNVPMLDDPPKSKAKSGPEV